MKVIVKGRENRDQLEVFSIEEFVPAEHPVLVDIQDERTISGY